MPVALVLNEDQMEVFNAATKGSKLEIAIRGRQVSLTRDNHEEIRELVVKLRDKKLAVKTKTVMHLETCYFADQILTHIDRVTQAFKPLPTENDNEIGLVVDNTETDEESAVESEVDEDSGTTDNGSEG